MELQKTVQYWVEGSRSDLEAAETLFNGGKYPQCLFWCHLVLEKLLKAHVVLFRKTQAPYTHNLVQLSENTGIIFSEEQKKWLRDISDFNLMGRYADEMMDFIKKCTPEFSQQYFSITKELYQWLLSKIPSR